MQILRTKQELDQHITKLKLENRQIGFVPTMGALHQGHVALIKAAAKLCDAVVVSIFVNPLQFGENEDFRQYPRTEARDIELLEQQHVSAVYLPTAEMMYPEMFTTRVTISRYNDILCAKSRPGHFDGVATILTKLFLQVQPDRAFFGEKDYQQLVIVRQLVKDLDFPVRVFGVPIARDTDGLALSSRNAYLNEKERRIAPALYETMMFIAGKIRVGRSPVYFLTKEARNLLLGKGFDKVEYMELRDAATLEEITNYCDVPARLLVAVQLGRTRLIDNIEVMPTAVTAT